MPADLISVDSMLDVIVRAAMKREYDKGGTINNAAAFATAVKRRETDNDLAIPGTLRIAYLAGVKALAEDEPEPVDSGPYSMFVPDEDHIAATKSDANRWVAIQFAMFGLPREHPLRVAIRQVTTYQRPWEDEGRQPTDAEQAEAEAIAHNALTYLEALANDHDVHLEHDHGKRIDVGTPTIARPIRGELQPIMPSRQPDPDDAPIVARSEP